MFSTKLVGILNITPNSFSDGGLFLDPEMAAKQLELLLEAGADVIDIGAVSTKPRSIQPSIEEEIARFNQILPAITSILKNSSVEVSIDSYNFETVKYLTEQIPVHWINDQKGFIDNKMIELAKDIDAKLVIMHHLTIPTDPSIKISEEVDPIEEVSNWLLEKADYLIKKGVNSEKIILDPGVGFGKTALQSWQLIREAKDLSGLGFSVMYGHSRKSFLNLVTDKDFIHRDLETSIISSYLAEAGVDYLRVHDVESTARALKLQEFLGV
jgi:dihydropteroate synthase